MQMPPVKSWKTEFARSTEAERYREILRRANEEAKKRDRDDVEERKASDDVALFQAAIELATPTEMHEFELTLVHYDNAIYDALIENEKLLDEERQKLVEMYEKAHVLPDGRRVFESEDGLRVFAEDGTELSTETITPEEIEDWLPKAEAVFAQRDAVEGLVEERGAILAYQTAVSDARELAEGGELTKDELADLKKSLEEKMPERVREHLPDDYEPSQDAVAEQPETVWRPSVKLDLPNLG